MALDVCFVSPEFAPFAKAGGLGDVSSALTRFLHENGHDVRVFLPLYSHLETQGQVFLPVEFMQNVAIAMGPHHYQVSLYTAALPGTSLWGYFIHCPALYSRPTMYTSDPDEHLRFAVLSRAAIEACARMGWAPHVFHCNDWQTALIPLYLKSVYAWDQLFSNCKTLLTLHNIGYQGVFGAATVDELGLAEHASLLHQDDLRADQIGFLKTGILHADALNTVSPNYADEVCTPEFGAGLHELLSARRESFVGILNGVDYDEWSPETDRYIPYRYSSEDLSGKARNTRNLLHALGLDYAPTVPTVGMVTRLTWQKGLDLLPDVLPQILQRHDMRLVVLGSGEARYETFFSELQTQFPSQVCFYRGYNDGLAHLIEAGSDIFLMPSFYEPCGLNQMYSLRYGTLPVVRRTGGLADTVRQLDSTNATGTGVLFEHFDATGLAWALDTVLPLFRDRELWLKIMRNGMAEDFSWDRSGREYLRLYEQLAS